MKKCSHETINLQRTPNHIVYIYSSDKSGQIKRAYNNPDSFDSIVGTVLELMDSRPNCLYDIKDASKPKANQLTGKQQGILEQIVALHNQGAKLEYARREIGELKAERMEQILERSYAAVTQRMKGGRSMR